MVWHRSLAALVASLTLAACSGKSTPEEARPPGEERPSMPSSSSDASLDRDAGPVEPFDAGVADAGETGPLSYVSVEPFELVYNTSAQTPARYINDHTLIRALDGTWHLFGIVGNAAPPGQFPNAGLETKFAHATAPSPKGPWTPRPDVLNVQPSYFQEGFMWAPHVIENNGTYYMFYAGGGPDGAATAINLATSKDLYSWTRIPSGPLFRDGLVARDPFVTRVNNQWVMYYTATEQPGSGRHVVAYRTSSDLLRWSARQIAFLDPTSTANSVSVTESPVVIKRDAAYFLFIGPRRGYEGTDVFRSDDPFHFEPSQYVSHLPGHAAEVFADGDSWWASAAGSVEQGLYVARLTWQRRPSLFRSAANPSFASDAEGRLHAFSTNAQTGEVLYRSQLAANGAWSAWSPFGPVAGSVPSVSLGAGNKLHVFTVDPTGRNVQVRTQRDATSFGEWQPFASDVGAVPSVAQQADGRLAAFVLGPNGSNIQLREEASGGGFGAWQPFGGPAGAPPTVSRAKDGRLEVFALGPAGAYIAWRRQLTPSGAWSGWETIGGPAAMVPVVALEADGRRRVIAMAPGGFGVNTKVETAPGSGVYGGWESFYGGLAGSNPVVAPSLDGRLEAFILGGGKGELKHRYQVAQNGAWSNWEVFGGRGPCAPTIVAHADGRLTVFYALPDGSIQTRTQVAPSSAWGPWEPYSGPVGDRVCGSPT